MSKNVINRRSLLRGLGGVAIALPALEIMGWSRFAHAAPVVKKKFVSMLAGGSLGDMPAIKGGNGKVHPATVGQNYETTVALKPLEKYKVKPLVGIATGLRIPTGSSEPGARLSPDKDTLFHGHTVFPQLSGEKDPSLKQGDFTPRGSTCDQIVAAKLGAKYMNARVQPTSYRGGGADSGRGLMSYNKGVKRDPYASPRTIFDTFLSNFEGAAGAAAATGPSPEVLAARAGRKSVLDLVGGGIQRLNKRLGAADALTMQSHLEFIRQIEKDLDSIDIAAGGTSCRKPTPLGADPAVGNDGAAIGWSGENLRATTMVDLLALGLACDLWQVSTLQVSFHQVFVSANLACGVDTTLDIHELGHGQYKTADDVPRCVAWAIDPFARLVSLLQAQKDVDGSPMINNTALTMCFEGGWGETEGDGSHSTENMIALYAGLAGGMKPQHVRADGAHPAQVLYSAMTAVGVADPLGDFNTRLPGMFA